MKVDKHTEADSFKPFELTILVESEYEQDMLETITALDVSIPEAASEQALGDSRDKLYRFTYEFLRAIHKALNSK